MCRVPKQREKRSCGGAARGSEWLGPRGRSGDVRGLRGPDRRGSWSQALRGSHFILTAERLGQFFVLTGSAASVPPTVNDS